MPRNRWHRFRRTQNAALGSVPTFDALVRKEQETLRLFRMVNSDLVHWLRTILSLVMVLFSVGIRDFQVLYSSRCEFFVSDSRRANRFEQGLCDSLQSRKLGGKSVRRPVSDISQRQTQSISTAEQLQIIKQEDDNRFREPSRRNALSHLPFVQRTGHDRQRKL